MSAEYPTEGQLEYASGQANELANRLLLTEDERSLILKKVGLILHGETESKELEELIHLAGLNTSGLLEEWLELHFEAYLFGDLDPNEPIILGEGLRYSRNEDDWLRALPL
ncbi:hypothetical protein A2115_03405 [Candidatus Woesebacteria bacterium GWA1_41_8]|uniref:Uncharacterized protein n=1 Tax=Candidatus Woesebacteria bacterium GWA1_41_8 TaxID=1802471 RepID=A0A1F7WJY0_9BACT|nr:MAG: hypothetical protein A2115_03405 [Candidatus Woesebacteria bacterium GWA1_41_8]